MSKKSSKLKLALLIPDCHRPWHDKRAYSLMIQVAKHLKPDGIYIMGDYADTYNLSGHGPKDPRIIETLKDEVDDVNAGLDELDKLFPYAKKYYISGNHEFRMARYIQNRCPEIFGFVDCVELFKINQRKNWTWINYGPTQKTRVLESKLFIRHEPIGSSAKATASKALCSIAWGHTHKIEESHITGLNGEEHVAFSCGWLGQKKADEIFGYCKSHQQWQLGFGLVYVDPVTKNFYHQIIHILDNYTCVAGGRIFKYEKNK